MASYQQKLRKDRAAGKGNKPVKLAAKATTTDVVEKSEPVEPAEAKVEKAAQVTRVTVTRRRWAFDEGGAESHHIHGSKPPGYTTGHISDDKVTKSREEQTSLIYKAAMGVATAPGKQLLMTGFMLWMTGNSLQIFSIMMLGMAFWQPLQKLLNVNAEFARFADSEVDLTLPKLAFIGCNLLALGLALYKSQAMGLLPTSAIDWLGPLIVRPAKEISSGSISVGGITL